MMNLELKEEARNRQHRLAGALLAWGEKNIRDFPWRKERTPYRILVAEVILRRTTSTAALRVYEEFLKKWPDIKSLANANVDELEQLLVAVGYHKQRSRILVNIARFIDKEFGGNIPNDKKQLLKIPHVGPYTAGAILSLGYGIPAPMVDSNVQRILSRVFNNCLPKKGRARAISMLVEALLPKKGHIVFNLGLLDLGALICRYDRPRCKVCPLSDLCDVGRKRFKK